MKTTTEMSTEELERFYRQQWEEDCARLAQEKAARLARRRRLLASRVTLTRHEARP